jgi:nucleolar protein 4
MTAAPVARPPSQKSTDCTVFCRFVPACDRVRRHHLEALGSQVGPVKKSAVIHKTNNKNEVDAAASKSSFSSSSSFAFLKYTVPADAVTAARVLHHQWLTIPATSVYEREVRVQLQVQLASSQQQQQQHDHPIPKPSTRRHSTTTTTQRRILVRNVSFYATAAHIQTAFERLFGPVHEVHLPMVSSTTTNTTHHRGFAFVTFVHAEDAAKCLESAKNQDESTMMMIRNRPVQVCQSVPKDVYEQQQQQQGTKKPKNVLVGTNVKSHVGGTESDEDVDKKESDTKDNDDMSETNSDDRMDDDDRSQTTNKDDKDPDNGSNSHNPTTAPTQHDTTAVTQHRCVFVRNLPFDVTRHDVFDLLRPYGHITAVYLVRDKVTGIPKGTAFCSFSTAAAAAQAAAASANPTSGDPPSLVSQQQQPLDPSRSSSSSSWTTGGGVLTLAGRRIFVTMAVDRDTARTWTAAPTKTSTDRRNLYLKEVGRVHNSNENDTTTTTTTSKKDAWDALPESDRFKRSSAWAEKNTKLRSPLFFINPFRLSVRNLAKHVDEAGLKRLAATAVAAGRRVTADDQIAHWTAAGDDVRAKMEAAAAMSEGKHTTTSTTAAAALVPEFDPTNIKKYIRSVFINREFVAGGTTKDMVVPSSRGFGFIEFEHHVHALACLRELNNNTAYSEEYVTGGKKAVTDLNKRKQRRGLSKKKIRTDAMDGDDDDGRVRIPRLIVEFAVENKAKAKEQAEHRAAQQANAIKQKMQHAAAMVVAKEKKKKSRGALQREKKRKQRQEATGDDDDDDDEKDRDAKAAHASADPSLSKSTASSAEPVRIAKKPAAVAKPPRKKKLKMDDQQEKSFATLVESYERTTYGSESAPEKRAAVAKAGRWFD